MTVKGGIRKTIRILAAAVSVLVVLLLAVVVLLQVRQVRIRLLDSVISRAGTTLPGDLSIEEADWPNPGTLSFGKITWIDGPDTLVSTGGLRLSVDLSELIRKDVHIRELTADGLLADIPAIMERFGTAGGKVKAAEDPGKVGGFPREGSIPGIPSVAADLINVDGKFIRLSEGFEIRGLRILCRADLLRHSDPFFELEHLSLDETSRPVSVDSLWLHADLAAPALEGGGVLHLLEDMIARLDCGTEPDGSFSILLTGPGGLVPPEAIGLAVTGKASVRDRKIESVDFEAQFLTPSTSELAGYPFLSNALSDIGDLEGIRGSARGSVGLDPELTAGVVLVLGRTSYLDTLYLSGSYGDEIAVIDTLILGMPGILLSASGEGHSGGAILSAHTRIDSTAWLTRILPGVKLPEGTSAELFLDTAYDPGPRETEVSLRGRAAAGGATIDSIHVSGLVPAENDRPYIADIMIETFGTRILTNVSADLSSGTDIVLSRPESTRSDSAAVFLNGRGRIDDATHRIRISDFRIEGALGTITAGADIDSIGNGQFDLLGEWAAPPPVLRTMADIDLASWDTLSSIWTADGPFDIRLGGNLTGGGAGLAVNAAGSAKLPSPRMLEAFLETGGAFADLGVILLRFDGSFESGDSISSFEGRLDLGRTEWMDTALVSLSGSGTTLSVDTALIAFEGMRFTAAGDMGEEALDMRAALSLADSQLVRRLAKLAGRDIGLAVDAMIDLEGDTGQPRIRAELDGTLRTAGLAIPRLTGEVSTEGSSIEAEVATPEGLLTDVVQFDSVTITYAGAAGEKDGPGAVVLLEARSPSTEILLTAGLTSGNGFSILADTLFIGISGQNLASERPFEVSTLHGGGVRIDDLELAGTVGSIVANGSVSPDSADLMMHISIVMPEKPEVFKIADRLWPDSIKIDARAEGTSRLRADGRVSNITIGDGIRTDISFEVVSDKLATRASLLVRGQERSILSIEGSLPPVHTDWSITGGPILLDVKLDDMPVSNDMRAVFSDKPKQVGLLGGTILARGTLADPEAVMNLECSFSGGKELEKYTLSLDGSYASGTVRDTALTRLLEESGRERSVAGETDAPAISAALALTKSGREVVAGSFFYPVTISFSPFSFDPALQEEMHLEIVSSELSLTDIDPLMPPDVDLEGLFITDLTVSGDAGNPAFNGHLETKEMSLAVAKNLQISPTVDLDFGGTLEKPSIKGTVVIERALLRLPETKEELHPVEGDALLFEAVDSFFTSADSTYGLASSDTASADATAMMKEMDLDISISIPNSFRIQSERLNFEMEGNLRIQQRGSRPVVTGELKPRSGRLSFMGRYFEIQRGSVFFYGEDEMNPSFDLTLQARVSDVDISIKLTGTAIEPEVELTSDPQMSESDIMSLLLFGRSMSDLDGSQSNLLQQRTAEILMVYGASRLEGEMSERLGVDMFTFQQSTRDPNKTALTVGKYINSKTMLKYEQGLENAANFLINLEYYITRQLKLETFIDQNSETGLEINWSREY